MISIGCDFGLRKSGIVAINDKFEIESQNLIQTHPDTKGAARLVVIEKAFDSIVLPFVGEDLELFVEGYAYGAKYQRESLAELGGIVRRYLHLANHSFWIIPPTTLKLFVTGTGKATKNYMKKCTKEQWGQAFKSDDVCDGYGLARLGMEVMKAARGVQGFAHLDKHKQDVLMEVSTHPEIYRNSNTAARKTRKRKT